MPQLRQNLATKEWVIISTGRAQRPEDIIAQGAKKPNNTQKYSPACPFCPGNESKTPDATSTVEGADGWLIRTVPNKFSALIPEGSRERHLDGIIRCMDGVGIHEVIIETPVHNQATALLPLDHLKKLLAVYRERYLHAMHDSRIELVTIFKNHGEAAGTSLLHPHSQMIATPVVPHHIRHRIAEAMSYFDDQGECVYCKIIKDELRLKERVIFETELFVAFVVYAAVGPYHSWIMPKRHASSFGAITDEEIADMALMLKTVLLKYYRGLNDPDFNYVIRTIPGEVRRNDFYHWYLSIIPRITKAAGFELGSGIYINTFSPEENAAYLRGVQVGTPA